jgi:hypothetical protein
MTNQTQAFKSPLLGAGAGRQYPDALNTSSNELQQHVQSVVYHEN